MKALVFIVATFILLSAGYVAFSFVQFSWSVNQWHWITRAIFAVYFFAVLITVNKNINGKTI